MKKILLSLSIIVIFAIYALHQKMEKAGIALPSMTPTPAQGASSLQPTISQSETTSPAAPSPTIVLSGKYKDGTYVGSVADAFYGNIQVQATIQNGKITDVQFLQYPSERGTSVEINSQAMPYLKQEAITVQNAQVDVVSGATQTSLAFRQSLQSALNQAK